MTDSQPRAAFGRSFPPRLDWLARAPAEPILEPGLPIIDTHHHLWHRIGPGVVDYPYFLPDFLADCATGHNIIGTVFVQCHTMYRASGPVPMRSVGETEFAAGAAAMSASGQYGKTRVAAGIVGFADLTAGDWVTPVLEAHLRAGGGRFRGVRHSANYDADPTIGNGAPDLRPGLYLRPDFRTGLARLTALGLSFDAWAFHPQLPDVTDLARAFPATQIIMNHLGGPLGYGRYTGKQHEVFVDWKRGIVELAKCPNVHIKLGGVMIRLAAYDYVTADAPPSSTEFAEYWRPYVETCIELFGPERCMVESNFPVEKTGIGFAALFNVFKRLTASASADEKIAIFAGTARRVYRLEC